MSKYRVLHPYFLMRELFEKAEGINVAEIGGCNGSDESWPSRPAFEISQTNYLGTDIEVDQEGTREINGHSSQTMVLDAIDSDEKINGRNFELIFSLGFFGHPTNQIASLEGESAQVFEGKIFTEWAKHTRPGGYFITGTRNEGLSIDPELMKKLGFEFFIIPPEAMQHIDYLIARKRGIYEKDHQSTSEAISQESMVV